MKSTGKIIGVGALVAVCTLVTVFVCLDKPAMVDETSSGPTGEVTRKGVRNSKRSRGGGALKSPLKLRSGAKETGKKTLRTKRRPVMDEDADLSHLTLEQRTTLSKIRSALDDDDFKAVRALAQKVQSSKDWPDKIPIELRKELLNALSWFGIKALPEITGFLADADADVLEEAVSAYEDVIREANGDRELQQAVLAASRAINDADAMESILSELNNMRNSVAVETIKQIMATGTEAAKNALPEAIEFFTGQEGITTPEQLDAWYNDSSGDNKDAEDAEEFYGAQSN